MPFNIKDYALNKNDSPLKAVLTSFNIYIHSDKDITIKLGDHVLHAKSVEQCKIWINQSLKELRYELWILWHEMSELSSLIVQNSSVNNGSIDNLVFLKLVGDSMTLSGRFSDLEDIHKNIKTILDIDIINVNTNLIKEFNNTYIKIISMHSLAIM